ncbi:hypothetical protein SLE2022_269030 [Rubroshorea leprosula]
MDVQSKLHIAVFPWLAYGHIIPFLEVSKFLAQMGHRVLYISTSKNISRLLKLPSEFSPNLCFIELPLPHVQGLPQGAESTADLQIQKVPFLKKAYDKLQGLLGEFLETSRVDWIIHDFAPYWLPPLAAQLGINLAFFSIVGASSVAFIGPPDKLIAARRERRPEDLTVIPEWIDYPSNVAFKLHEVLSHQQCEDQDAEGFFRWGSVVQGCQVVTLRSCPEFEREPFNLFGKILQKPVAPIGLLPPSVPLDGVANGDETWVALKKWLDGMKEKSVFYVALGTEATLSPEQSHELASSGFPFIWVVKNRPLVEGQMGLHIFPQGFEERVSELGVVVRGASSDLGLVARLLHGKRVGFEIERNEVDGSFTSDTVAKVIRVVMVEEEGEPIRAKAWAMKEICGNIELGKKHLAQFARFLENYK